MSDVILGPPIRPVQPTGERWVLVDKARGLWRDAASHPDPAHQRMKCVPTVPPLFPTP